MTELNYVRQLARRLLDVQPTMRTEYEALRRAYRMIDAARLAPGSKLANSTEDQIAADLLKRLENPPDKPLL